jgi:hypothetical protein
MATISKKLVKVAEVKSAQSRDLKFKQRVLDRVNINSVYLPTSGQEIV